MYIVLQCGLKITTLYFCPAVRSQIEKEVMESHAVYWTASVQLVLELGPNLMQPQQQQPQ